MTSGVHGLVGFGPRRLAASSLLQLCSCKLQQVVKSLQSMYFSGRGKLHHDIWFSRSDGWHVGESVTAGSRDETSVRIVER